MSHCIAPLLKDLKLSTFVKNHEGYAREAKEKNHGYVAYLQALSSEELAYRSENRIKKMIYQAKFPAVKRLSDFQFHHVPNLDKQKILELSNCDWISKASNCCFMGQTGLGKTHLAIALGYEACKKKITTCFYTAAHLVNHLAEAKDAHTLLKFQKRLARFQLVIIDELGYIPLSKKDAELLFQFFSERYEQGSLIVTTNLEFPKWTSFMNDTSMTTALLDRFTHHCHIFTLVGESYRFAQRKRRHA